MPTLIQNRDAVLAAERNLNHHLQCLAAADHNVVTLAVNSAGAEGGTYLRNATANQTRILQDVAHARTVLEEARIREGRALLVADNSHGTEAGA